MRTQFLFMQHIIKHNFRDGKWQSLDWEMIRGREEGGILWSVIILSEGYPDPTFACCTVYRCESKVKHGQSNWSKLTTRYKSWLPGTNIDPNSLPGTSLDQNSDLFASRHDQPKGNPNWGTLCRTQWLPLQVISIRILVKLGFKFLIMIQDIRNMNSFKHLLMIDLDELIVPYKKDTLTELTAG